MNQSRKGVVIGGGTMGADIASIFAAHGRDVEVVESDPRVRESVRSRIDTAVHEIGRASCRERVFVGV